MMRPLLAKRAVKYSGVSPIDQRLGALLGLDTVSTGVPVTENTATTISAVWCAINLLSNSIKLLPLGVFERLADGGNAPAAGHPAYRLLRFRPNPNTTPSRFKKLMIAWKLLWGNARAEIERDGRGRPIAFWPIHPSRCRTFTLDDGAVFHEVIGGTGATVTLPDRDVLHFMGMSLDGVTGLSLIGQARNSLGLSVSSEDYGARFFANNARPSVVITTAKPMQQEARETLRRSWQAAYTGENAHKTAVLGVGEDIKVLGMPNTDSQFLETRTFQILEIARWMNVPAHKLQELTRATFSNIEHQAIEFVQDSVMPLAKDIEEEIDRKVVDPQADGRFYTRFNANALLRGDSQSRASFYQTMITNGVYSINRVLSLEDENPIGPEGDVHYVPSNLTTAERIMEGDVVDVQPDSGDSAGLTRSTTADNTVSTIVPRDYFAEIKTECGFFAPILRDAKSRLLRLWGDKAASCARRSDPGAAVERGLIEHEKAAALVLAPIVSSILCATARISGIAPTEKFSHDMTGSVVARHMVDVRLSMQHHVGDAGSPADDVARLASAVYAAMKGVDNAQHND